MIAFGFFNVMFYIVKFSWNGAMSRCSVDVGISVRVLTIPATKSNPKEKADREAPFFGRHVHSDKRRLLTNFRLNH